MPEVRGKLWGAILWIAPLFGLNLSGVVLDAENRLPVTGASIICERRAVFSDNKGEFLLQNLSAGEYILRIEHVAYIPSKRTVSISEGTESHEICLLEPKIYISDPVVSRADKVQPKRGSSSIDGALEQIASIPGIALIRGNGEAGVSIRGSRAKDVLVVVDGVVQPKNERGFTDISKIVLSDIARAEVIVDGLPAEYSSIAPAGALFIETTTKARSGTELEFRVGSFGASSNTGELFHNLGALTSSIRGHFSSIDGDFLYTAGDSSATRHNNHQLSRGLGLEFGYSGLRDNFSARLNYYALDEGMPGDIFHPTPTAKRRGNSIEASIIFNRNFSSDWKTSIKFSTSESERDYLVPRPFVYVPVDSRHRVGSRFAQGIASRGFFGGDLEIQSGGCYSWESYKLNNRLAPSRSLSPPSREIGSAWIQSEYLKKFVSRTTIKGISNLRADLKEQVHEHYSIELSISQNLTPFVLAVSSGVSSAIRYPELIDLYWLRDALAEGNPELAPEESRKRHIQASAGASWRWAQFDLYLDLFQREIDSVIIWKRDFDGLYRPKNYSREEARGREDFLKIRLFNHFEASWSNTLINSIHRTSEAVIDSMNMPFVPGYRQKLSIVLDFGFLYTGINGEMIGKRFTLLANTKWTQPYEIWNGFVELRREVWIVNLSMRVDCYNIFNEEYEILPSFPMPERNWGASLRLEYSL